MMPPEIGLPFIIALDSVAFTGGSITAILLNIPGTGANAPTLIDGFPMTQKGEAGRALGAAVRIDKRLGREVPSTKGVIEG